MGKYKYSPKYLVLALILVTVIFISASFPLTDASEGLSLGSWVVEVAIVSQAGKIS